MSFDDNGFSVGDYAETNDNNEPLCGMVLGLVETKTPLMLMM